MQCDGRDLTVEVSADGVGLASHAGSPLLTQVAAKTSGWRGCASTSGITTRAGPSGIWQCESPSIDGVAIRRGPEAKLRRVW